MFTSTVLLAVTALAGIASAQLGPNTTFGVDGKANYSTSGPIAVPPDNVTLADRQLLCRNQQEQCPQICVTPTLNNTCDANTLTFNCTCSGGMQPNISNYQQALPAQICLIWKTNCVDAHPNDGTGIAACRSVQCGNEVVAVNNATTTTTTSAPATTGTGSNTANTQSTTTSTTSSHTGAAAAATAFAFAQQYGTPLIAGGVAALFGLAL